MTDMKIIWYPVPGMQSTFVNRLGQIGTGKPGNVIYKAGKVNPKGYLIVYAEGNTIGQHILVALTFHGPKPSPKHEVDHIDDDRANNKPGNLRWLTHKQNVQHAHRPNKETKAWTNHKVPPRRLSDDEVRELLRDVPFMTNKDLRDKYKVPLYFIKQLLSAHGKQRNHKDSPHFVDYDYDGLSIHIDTSDLKAYSGGKGNVKVRQPD